jgi:hypothetical protein
MNPAALLTNLRARGIGLFAAGDRLRVEGPEALVTDELQRVLVDHKPILIPWLQERDELAALVERVGTMMQYLDRHAEEWTDEEWARNRDKLLAAMKGVWHRVGEPVPTNLPEDILTRVWRLVGELVPAGAATWAEEHLPELLERAAEAGERMEAAYLEHDNLALREAAIEMAQHYQALTEKFRARRLEGADLLEAIREVFGEMQDEAEGA